MEAQLTIRFRAEQDDFDGIVGYRVPVIRPHHVQISGHRAFSWLMWMDLTRLDLRLRKFAGQRLPIVLFAAEPDGWMITDSGAGSTATIAKTFTLTR